MTSDRTGYSLHAGSEALKGGLSPFTTVNVLEINVLGIKRNVQKNGRFDDRD